MMTPNEIRAALILNEVKVIDIAKSLDLKHSNVSVVISGGKSTPRVRQAIADAIGRPVDEVFPPQTEDAA